MRALGLNILRVTGPILIALTLGLFYNAGASKTDDEMKALRAQLAATQQQLAAQQKASADAKLAINGLTSLSKAHARVEAENATAAASNKVDADAKVTAAARAASDASDIQTAVALQASTDAKKAADAAAAAALAAHSGNNALIISQLGIFAALVLGYLFQIYSTRQKTKEVIRKEGVAETQRLDAIAELKQVKLDANDAARRADQKLDQIHILVNSAMTTAIQNELDARTANLLLMEAAVKQAGDVPSEFALAAIKAVQARIDALKGQLATREAQNEQVDRLKAAADAGV